MTEQENKEIMNLVDTIKGEVNRMCVTSELEELDTMMQHARNNIEKLGIMIYRSKFAEGSN